MYGQALILTHDLRYLLCVHKYIEITQTSERGILYTLKQNHMHIFLNEFNCNVLQHWTMKHIKRVFRCFKFGILSNIFKQLLINMIDFDIKNIIGDNDIKLLQFLNKVPGLNIMHIIGNQVFICFENDVDMKSQIYLDKQRQLNQNPQLVY